jgi:hypothetical protein
MFVPKARFTIDRLGINLPFKPADQPDSIRIRPPDVSNILTGLSENRERTTFLRRDQQRSRSFPQRRFRSRRLFAGMAVDFTGNYQTVFSVLLGNYLTSALLIFVARRPAASSTIES